MKKGLIALSPLFVFIAFYLITSIIAGDFYKIPITVAFMVSSIYAIIICGGNSESVRFTVASMLPIILAECAKAPAKTKIQIISIICSVAAPRL